MGLNDQSDQREPSPRYHSLGPIIQYFGSDGPRFQDTYSIPEGGSRTTEGAPIEIRYTKARGIYSSEAEPFEAQRLENGEWKFQAIENKLTRQVVDLLNTGLTQRQVADDLGIAVSTVNRHFQNARVTGLVNVD